MECCESVPGYQNAKNGTNAMVKLVIDTSGAMLSSFSMLSLPALRDLTTDPTDCINRASLLTPYPTCLNVDHDPMVYGISVEMFRIFVIRGYFISHYISNGII